MLLSGGIDSATTLYLMKTDHRVRALTFEYHGIAGQELRSAKAIGNRVGVREHRFIRLPDIREAADIPGERFVGLPPTYIPLRNGIFYSIAGSYAEETGASIIAGGHIRDDAGVFADSSLGFFHALERALWAGSAILRKNKMRIVLPLRRKSKAQVVKLSSSIGVPLELTWSCHRGGSEHCWKCAGCLSRSRSFERAGVADPLSLARRKIT